MVSLMSSPYRGPDADSLFLNRGLFWHRPILAAVMTVMMLSGRYPDDAGLYR
ncbi:hypothetical protein ACVXHB_24680 [Escherichia coli]